MCCKSHSTHCRETGCGVISIFEANLSLLLELDQLDGDYFIHIHILLCMAVPCSMLVPSRVAVAIWCSSRISRMDCTHCILSEATLNWSVCSHVHYHSCDIPQADSVGFALGVIVQSVVLHAV